MMLDFIGGFFLGFGLAFVFWMVTKQSSKVEIANPEIKAKADDKHL
jgi:hypothetical protein